jgi:hypothetical protein
MTPDFLPIRSALAITRRDPGKLYLMLRGYYDGSGKKEDSAYLTLTGIVASESVWEAFEGRWSEVLLQYGVGRFHMTDAMTLRQDFHRDYGWDDHKVDNLVRDLFNVLGEFRSTPENTRSNLVALSCTIDMNDYRRAGAENNVRLEPEAICVNYCFKIPSQDIDEPGKTRPELVMVFDRNECFQRMIYRVWQDFKSQRDAGWPKQVRDVLSRDRELVAVGTSNACPMQAADMIAWIMNNRQINPQRTAAWDYAAVIMVEHHSTFYDYRRLIEEYPVS